MTNSTDLTTPAPEQWKGDALGRKGYSEFLSIYIAERIQRTSKPLTIALDAGWGTGKTFFVNNWIQDLRSKNGGAVLFDAWKNDFAAEPLVSFMADLSSGMKTLENRIPKTSKLAKSVSEKSSSMLKGFGKAAGPASAVIAKGVLTKLTGVAIDQITDAIEASGAEPGLDWDKITGDADKTLEKSLDVFFQKTLEDHRLRANAAGGFRSSLESLVASLGKANAIEGPLYVFVDELDRCRPDYAIKLLEGIKHLFAVPGVVFVISTNLEQLSKSVQAIYGANFDGYNYLKRFFDFEFTLPVPNVYGFSQMLLQELPLFQGRQLDYGLHAGAYKQEKVPIARSFEVIATSCNLSLRDQRRVWNISAAAASGIPDKARISVLWLFFLAAIKHSYPRIFDRLSSPQVSRQGFEELCKDIGSLSQNYVKTLGQNEYGETATAGKTRVVDVLFIYYEATFLTIQKISNSLDGQSRRNYPDNLTAHMIGERPDTFYADVEYTPAIQKYLELVRMAGLLS